MNEITIMANKKQLADTLAKLAELKDYETELHTKSSRVKQLKTDLHELDISHKGSELWWKGVRELGEEFVDKAIKLYYERLVSECKERIETIEDNMIRIMSNEDV